MAYKCFNCHKGIMWGHNVSHSKRRTRRVFKPNLQYKRIKVGRMMKRVRLCTDCIKLMRKREARLRASQEAALPASGSHL